jgi:hypothetical protein
MAKFLLSVLGQCHRFAATKQQVHLRRYRCLLGCHSRHSVAPPSSPRLARRQGPQAPRGRSRSGKAPGRLDHNPLDLIKTDIVPHYPHFRSCF